MSLTRPRSPLKDGVAIRRPIRTRAYIDQHLGLPRICAAIFIDTGAAAGSYRSETESGSSASTALSARTPETALYMTGIIDMIGAWRKRPAKPDGE